MNREHIKCFATMSARCYSEESVLKFTPGEQALKGNLVYNSEL